MAHVIPIGCSCEKSSRERFSYNWSIRGHAVHMEATPGGQAFVAELSRPAGFSRSLRYLRWRPNPSSVVYGACRAISALTPASALTRFSFILRTIFFMPPAVLNLRHFQTTVRENSARPFETIKQLMFLSVSRNHNYKTLHWKSKLRILTPWSIKCVSSA